MEWTKLLLLPLFALIFSSLIKDSYSQTITIPPVNTAARVGDSAQLNCTVERGPDTLEWRHFIGTPTGTRIYDSTTGTISDPRFDVLQAGNGEYDLMVKDVQNDLAGLYQCGLIITDNKAAAELVTLSGMTRDPLPGSRTIVENTEITLSCDVTYYGYKAPVMEWYNDAGTLLPSHAHSDVDNPNKITVTTNLTARAEHDMMDFECRLKFEREAGDTADAPDYTDHIMTHFMVQHAVTGIMVDPDPADSPDNKIQIEVGGQINCTASGRPEPTYNWYSEDGSDVVIGQFLLIRDNMVGEHTYRCEATNRIMGQDRKAEKTVTFIATERTTPPPVTSGGTAPWIIAVAVVVPIVVIVAVLIGVFVALKPPWAIALMVILPLLIIFVTVAIHCLVRYRKNKLPEKLQNINIGPGFGGPKNNGVRNPPVPASTGASNPVGSGPRPNPDFQPARGPPYGGPPQREMSRGPGMGGVAVIPPGAQNEQQLRRTKDSPGYGDLGIRHFGGSNPGLDHNVSMDMDTGPVYSSPNKGPGYDNRVYKPSPSSQRHPISARPGTDSVV